MQWTPDLAPDTRGIDWQLRRAGEIDAGLSGSFNDWTAGNHVIAAGLLPATACQLRARMVLDREASWTEWVALTTPDIRIGAVDLTATIAADLEKLNAWVSGGVTDLPGNLADLAQDIADEATARAQAVAGEASARAAAVLDLANQITAEVAARVADAHLAASRWREQRDAIRAALAGVVDLANASHEAREEIRRSLSAQLGAMGASFAEQIVTLVDADQAAALRLTTLEAGNSQMSVRIDQAELARVAGDAAQAASDLAGGKGKVLFQNSAPATADRQPQNLWIDTTGGANTPKRWNGSAWVAVTDKVATDAATAAGSALAGLAGKADASAVSNLTTRVDTVEGKASAQADAITQLSASTTDGVIGQANFRMSVLAGPAGYSRIGAQTRQNGTGD